MSNNISERNTVVSGLFWKTAERVCAQGVSFIVSIVLARILNPNDYGLVAMVTIFISLADVFINSGFNTALIQKKDADETDFSTIFYCSLIVSVLLYFLLFAIAPYVADFYREPDLKLLLRVFAIRIPLAVYNSIQHAYVSRHMIFKRFFFSTIIGTIISGFVGVWMAFKGFGPYALIGQYFTNTVIDTLVLSITVNWHPRKLFSWNRAKGLMNYGWKVLVADLSGTFFDQLRSLLIGRVYTSADLAYYNRGKQFPNMINTNISASVMTVLFPAISNDSDDISRVNLMTRRALKCMAYLIFPAMAGLACVAKPLVRVLLTSKWDNCIIFLQILSIVGALEIWGNVSLQTLKAIGKSGSLVKLELIKKPIYLILLIIGMKINVVAIAVTMLIYTVYGTYINMRELSSKTGYSTSKQFLDVLPEIFATCIMAACIYVLNYLPIRSIFILIIQIVVAVLVYLAISKFFKMESYEYIMKYFKDRVGREGKKS